MKRHSPDDREAGDDAPEDDAPEEGRAGSEAMPRSFSTGSERYHGDSARYQEVEGEDDREADEWMPDGALAGAASGTDGLEPDRREWQVNVRLDRGRYAMLKKAADVYGTTPTALARMLLNRGCTAILNAHRAEMAAFEWADPRG